jgi:hypothetical protein
MEIKQIVFELPMNKETKNRVKYGTEQEEFKNATVGGQLYPTRAALANAFGHFPQRIKVTIEEV